MSQRLSDSIVKGLDPPASGNRIEYDSEVKGFGCRITAAGARAFVLNYRTNSGRERRYTIGAYPDWKTSAAREEAKRLKQQIRVNGADPVGGLETERAAPTVADLCTRYIEEHAKLHKRLSSQVYDAAICRNFIEPALRHKKVAEVTFSDISSLHRKITRNGTPHRANRVVALLSKMFSLAIQWEWRPERDNPCKGIQRNDEAPRERYLTGDELVRLGEALAKYPDQQAANAIRLLLLTGARRGEVLSATWAQIDFTEGTWTKPSSHTKTKKTHHIPLSAPALLLLSELHAVAERQARETRKPLSPYVFPGRIDGHRVDLKKPWPAICKAANITGVRVHDLRHSFASIAASGGASLPMIGKLLGHTQVSTTQRYAHLNVDPLRELTDRVGAIVTGKPVAQVVPIKGRA